MTTKLLSAPAAAATAPSLPLSGLVLMAGAFALLLAIAVLAAYLAAGGDGLQLGHLRELLPNDPRAWTGLTA